MMQNIHVESGSGGKHVLISFLFIFQPYDLLYLLSYLVVLLNVYFQDYSWLERFEEIIWRKI